MRYISEYFKLFYSATVQSHVLYEQKNPQSPLLPQFNVVENTKLFLTKPNLVVMGLKQKISVPQV